MVRRAAKRNRAAPHFYERYFGHTKCSQHNSESVWASISLKDHSKLIVGSFYRPPDKGIEPILNLETELSEITEKLRNNSKYTVMLGGDFNAANIDWDTGIVPDSTDNRLMKEKLVTVLAEAGLTQMQRDPTRGQNYYW